MGEAKQRREKLRASMLAQADDWSRPPSAWEAELVEELLDMPAVRVPRLPATDITWMGMPANECHANTRWYERNDRTGQAKSVSGWWLQGLDFVLHSVLGNQGQYRCITPSAGGETEIIFIADPKIEWVETGDVYSPRRNGQFVGLGVRRFPAFTRALNETVRARLLAGMDPYRALEFSQVEMDDLKAQYLSAKDIASLEI